MPSHKIQSTGFDRLKSAVPFGLGQVKPKHFRDMAGVTWKNRDNLGYAWKVLSRGVCDGCALGVAGFHDWTIPGVHLCMTRLNLLRLNTMPELDGRLLEEVSRLESLDNTGLRELGRLPFPMLREKGARGFRRISWQEAYERIALRIRGTDPRRWAMFLTSRGLTNEVYYMAQKVARFLGTNNVDNAARLCHAPSTAAMKHAIGVAATTCSYRDWFGTDLVVFFGANPAMSHHVGPGLLRPLAGEEDLGRELLHTLDSEQQATAILAPVAPTDIVQANRPFVEDGEGLKLTADPAGRAICGISSGGICAFTVAWNFPDRFGRVLSHCGSFVNIDGGHNYPFLVRSTPHKPIRVLMQDGANDGRNVYGDWPLANQEMAAALAFAGYDYPFVHGQGFHSPLHGRAILPDSLRWLWRDA